LTDVTRLPFIFFWLWCLTAFAAETIPPSPDAYFNDYAHVVNPGVAAQINSQLQNFEQATGNQIVVAVFPKMQSDSDMSEYTVRVFRSWKVGQKDKNNGAVLFVFIQDHKIFLQTGYGLEGVLPDALCEQIIHDEIEPRFKVGDYSGGLTAGVNAILAATAHEYKGTGTTVNQRQQQVGGNVRNGIIALVIIGFILFQWLVSRASGRHGWGLSSGGWGGYYGGGGWGGGGGGGFSGGGGGFSGGGGSTGGGGAGGSW
jgi:uncharacterized protein